MKSFKQFLEDLERKQAESQRLAEANRMKELAGIQESNFQNRYAILITVETTNEQLLLEHEQYKKFKKGTDLYTKHPEQPHIPVMAHYHVVDGKTKKEIYAVNMDGTAHHRTNKGYKVPDKQAAELAKLGVNFKEGNILESIDFKLNESTGRSFYSYFIIIEE